MCDVCAARATVATIGRALRAAGDFKGIADLEQDFAAVVAPAWSVLWPEVEDTIVRAVDGRSGVPTEGELLSGLDNARVLVAEQWPPKAIVADVVAVSAEAFGAGKGEALALAGARGRARPHLRAVRAKADDLLAELDMPTVWQDLLSDLKFSVVDERAAGWLSRDSMYWIGNAWDEGLGREISDAALKVLTEGGSRTEVAAALRAQLGGRFAKTDSYWEVVGSATLGRARAMGSVSGWEDTGVSSYRIVGVADERQSKICETLNGTVIEVIHAVEHRNALLEATDPQAVKKLSPWLREDKVLELAKQGPQALAKAGLALPPYHGRCRTTVVMESF